MRALAIAAVGLTWTMSVNACAFWAVGNYNDGPSDGDSREGASDGALDTSTPGHDAGSSDTGTQGPETAGDTSADTMSSPADSSSAEDSRPPQDSRADAPPSPCNLSAPFGAPTPVSSLNDTFLNLQAEFSPNLLTAYFESNRLGMGLNVFTATRATTQGPFTAVTPIASLNFDADTWNVTMTGDLGIAYFVTDQGGSDHMYVASRSGPTAAFGSPTQMPSPVVHGEQPFVLPNGQVLYFSDSSTGSTRIARATIGATPSTVTGVATVPVTVAGASDVGLPVLTSDESVMYFAAFEAGNVNSYDIWMATHASNGAWSAPVAVSEVNTTGFDSPSWVSDDNCTLYLSHAGIDAGAATEIEVAVRPQ